MAEVGGKEGVGWMGMVWIEARYASWDKVYVEGKVRFNALMRHLIRAGRRWAWAQDNTKGRETETFAG